MLKLTRKVREKIILTHTANGRLLDPPVIIEVRAIRVLGSTYEIELGIEGREAWLLPRPQYRRGDPCPKCRTGRIAQRGSKYACYNCGWLGPVIAGYHEGKPK